MPKKILTIILAILLSSSWALQLQMSRMFGESLDLFSQDRVIWKDPDHLFQTLAVQLSFT